MVGYKYAYDIAVDFCKEIENVCEIPPEIVGSLRRKKMQVNDIDILVIPKLEQVKDDTLFGNPTSFDLLEKKLANMCLDNIMKLETNGSKIKRFSRFNGSETPIDLYIANKETLPTLRLIRTGSKEYNIKLCQRARSMMMHLKADGSGLMDEQLRPLKVTSEEDIFKLLGLEYVPPEKRWG